LIGGLIGLWLGAPVRAADYPAWLAADLNPDPPTPEFALFPIRGPRLIVPLPESLRNRTISVFGAEGKAVCALTARGIIKVEFNPLRQEIIPGSSEVSSIWSLTVVRESGHVFVSGLAARGGCGTFEIDPRAGTVRTILAGPLPHCGGGGGAVSPDGKRIAKYKDGKLELADVKGGAVRVIGGFGESMTGGGPGPGHLDWADINWMYRAGWSPDGRWISLATRGDRIVLIDSGSLERRRNLGPSVGQVSMAWSPDAKYLLAAQPDSLFFNGSLVAVDVETGRRFKIKGTHHNLTGRGPIGWMDPSIARSATLVGGSRSK